MTVLVENIQSRQVQRNKKAQWLKDIWEKDSHWEWL